MSQKKHSLRKRHQAELVDRQGNPPSLHLNQQKNIPTKIFWEKWNTVLRGGALFESPFPNSSRRSAMLLNSCSHSWRDWPPAWGWWRVSSPALPELLVHRGAFPVHPAIPKGSSAGTSIQRNPLERLCCSAKAPPQQWQHPAAGHTPCQSEMDGEIQGKSAKFATMDWLFMWEMFLSW